MDIGEIRSILSRQYADGALSPSYDKSAKFRRSVKQVKKDLEELDNIMARNFGMAYNPALKIYE